MSQQFTALITGASSGIGYELAKILAAKNYNLVLVARSKEKLEKLKTEILNSNESQNLKKNIPTSLNSNLATKKSINIKVIDLDLALQKSADTLWEILQRESISITHLINNAGVGEKNQFESSSWDKLEQMIDLNIKSLTKLCHLFLPELKSKPQSCILNVSSIAAFLPGPNMAVYYATKAYVQSFTEALAEELSGTSVKVVSLCPGPTLSGFQEAASISTNSSLFQGAPSSYSVALYAAQLIDGHCRVGIHGFKNKAMIFSLRFAPRTLVTKIVNKMQSDRSTN